MKLIRTIFLVNLFIIGMNTFAQDPHTERGLKKGIVQEVLQVSSYTYLNMLEEDGAKQWLALPSMEAGLGEIYYYKRGMEMPNFTSTELNRTFESVIFLGSITNADLIDSETGKVDQSKVISSSKQPTLEKLELTIKAIDGGTRIGDLFEHMEFYSEKKVKVFGEVTKFNGAIMGKNWVHFQDGSEYKGKYDLVITTQETVVVGDMVIFEGLINLNKDFGAGYFYDVIMEEAVLIIN